MDKSSDARRFILQEFVLAVLISVFVGVLSSLGMLDYFNWKLYDVIVTRHRRIPEHRDEVVFVCVDQKSIDYFDRESGIGWPWPRQFHAFLTDYLSRCGARAVVFDVIFSEQDIDRDEFPGEESDDEFASAIRESGVTYLAVAAREETVTESDVHDEKLYVENTGAFERIERPQRFKSAVYPLKKFSSGARGLGLVNMLPEKDGIHRRYPIVSKLGDRYVPSLAYAVARDILDESTLERRIYDQIGKNTYIDDEGKFLLSWYGTGGVGRGVPGADAVFRYYSYHAVIASALQDEGENTPVIPPEAFRGKIVIIGSNAPGLFDLKATPFTYANIYPGMEIHATAIENLLAGDFIYFVPAWILFLAMGAAAVALFVLERIFRNLRVFMAVFAVFVVCELAASYILFVARAQWLPPAELLGTTILVFSGLVISGYFKETKEKWVLRRSFGRYVNETVLNEILADPTSVDFRGRMINATIMATDIAGFTSISEKLPPREVVARLNDYLSEVSETLIDNGAYINKYIGDAILALFGAFGEKDHRRRACHAALRAREIIERKIDEAKDGNVEPFVTRFGITTGEMTMGNIGSERKIEYTVIGDTVNTAFRFEGLNKFYKTTIIVGETTRNGAGDDFVFRLLDVLRVKGKEKSEQVFELMGLKGEVSPVKLRWKDEFEEALRLYQRKRFEEAMDVFSRLHEEGDPTSGVFADRCRKFIAEPPPAEWNGVWVMMRK